ncbi:LysE family translocator [Rhodoplanes sp. Z2-YC6860]|uniref:LysE family translocator n=1 Tax=Rhodoplanes sp. Z2-YC6860 TaxID=674703 RepID=UPI00078ED472|nr:LysE family translocator [Rhodoplanes sp. Z2-YC6860]AMN38495.1 lysine exporter protein [Rhodoplanes sp. Z2-YC6860]
MDIGAYLVTVLLLELTPGPNMAYLATLALSRGQVAGLIATSGVALGLALHAIVAAFGAGLVVQQYPVLYDLLRWIGVGYLLYLSWRGWRGETELSSEQADLTPLVARLFLRGFLSNVFNPKSVLFFVSVLPAFVAPEAGLASIPTQMAFLGILYVAIATTIHSAIVLLAGWVGAWVVGGSSQQTVRRILSVVLAFVAVWLAWATAR